jgi:hypothetical protein
VLQAATVVVDQEDLARGTGALAADGLRDVHMRLCPAVSDLTEVVYVKRACRGLVAC